MGHEIALILCSMIIIFVGAFNISNMIEKYKDQNYFMFGLNLMCTLLPTTVLIVLWAEYIFST